ncbi:hypothetical protein PPL_00365 [Heterostelium album PN500]|uniref:Uncharacterized protein n=1 Tax=Heterostelium pallidum (strain ATCC 26659 / Pp 5 / PN500) TaxID=670386 RepID=D3AW91_HETP5|nr:hypothetical protein PPL_00365 [Heterostelium album PN500]EFA86564.1 hypothetical protein PPL_00365 [Heterostelium album PN500]|eukprot:XP_020438669.1 hypothetical protein PPL_00365 [Heterostelium album PN500]
MWISNFCIRPSRGLFLFWKPIKQNRYFVLEKNSENYIAKNNPTVPLLTYYEAQKTEIKHPFEQQQQKQQKDKQQPTQQQQQQTTPQQSIYLLTKMEEEQKTEMTSGFFGNMFSKFCQFSWTMVLAKVVPTSWTLDPNESFRINTVIQPFNSYQIATSNSPQEILDHWNQLENELYPKLKKLNNTNEKIDLLQTFLTKKQEREERDKKK